MTENELRIIADLALEMTKLRQNECKHLAVENLGPEVFGKLLRVYDAVQAYQAPRDALVKMGQATPVWSEGAGK